MLENELKADMKVVNIRTGEKLTYVRMDEPFAVCRDQDGIEFEVHPSHLESQK